MTEVCAHPKCGKTIVRRLCYRHEGNTYCSWACFSAAVAAEGASVIEPSKNKDKGAEMAKNKDKDKKKSAAPAAAPAKKETKAAKEPKAPKEPKAAQMFRPGSMVAQLYERLKDGKPITMANLFKGLASDDQHRLLTDLRNRGKKLEEFSIDRPEKGVLQLVPFKAAKAAK